MDLIQLFLIPNVAQMV
jgi:hypothetical protein